jgi:hypothetical protein
MFFGKTKFEAPRDRLPKYLLLHAHNLRPEGSHGNSHPTARIHIHTGRRSSCVVAGGARAAGGDTGTRVSSSSIARRLGGPAAWIAPGPRADSIVTNFYFTEPAWRLLQQEGTRTAVIEQLPHIEEVNRCIDALPASEGEPDEELIAISAWCSSPTRSGRT